MPKFYNSHAVRSNPSLNRTLCGSPILGFKSLAQNRPTAKCRLARTLDRTFSRPYSPACREFKSANPHCPCKVASQECPLRRHVVMKTAKQPARRRKEHTGNEMIFRKGEGRQAMTSSTSAAAARRAFYFVVKNHCKPLRLLHRIERSGQCGSSTIPMQCGLTHRSTGPFAAVQVWASKA